MKYLSQVSRLGCTPSFMVDQEDAAITKLLHLPGLAPPP